jgi:hypothetical protein
MIRGRASLIAIAAAIAIAGGSPVRAQKAVDPAALKTFDFKLGEEAYRIKLPPHASLMRGSGGDRFHVSLSTRAMRQMELRLAPDAPGNSYRRSQRLANGVVVTFEVIPAPEGQTGTGGPEESLEGRLQIGARTLAVRCSDQAEWPGSPDPTWCIDYLQHLAVVAGG